jgi:Flp pilus assembly protein TadG
VGLRMPWRSQNHNTGGVPDLELLHADARSESGSSLVELALVLPVLFLLLLGVADFGRAYYLGMEVSQAANSAALYGSQAPSDTAGIASAAVADAQDVAGFTTSSVTVTSGCECSDGSSPSLGCSAKPTCSTNSVTYVQVDTVATYKATFPYPGIPASIVLRGKARMRSQ